MSAKVQSEILAFQYQLLRERLAQCTEPQRRFFGRIYPGGVEAVPEKQLVSAIDLCDRTIRKNNDDPSRLES